MGDANAKPSASPTLNLFGPGHLLLLDLCSTYYSNVIAILLPFHFIVLKFVNNSPVLCVLFFKKCLYVSFPYSLVLNLSQIPPQRAQQCCLLPAAVACCCLLPVPSHYLPLSWQKETKPTLLQHSERILNSCALLKIYSCNFNHTFMYRLDWWKNKLLLLLLLLLSIRSLAL